VCKGARVYTIAVLNQKGGVGKTTLATNLAAAAHLDHKRALVIDMDRQGSALDWSAARQEGSALEGLVTVKVDRPMSAQQWRDITSGFDFVVLDGPARLGDPSRSAAVVADLVILPVQPGPYDAWAANETLEVIDSADAIRAELGRPAARRLFVINRAQIGTVMSRDAPAALRKTCPVADAVIHQRIAFVESALVGESVLTFEPSGAAAVELSALYHLLTSKRNAHGKAQAQRHHAT